MAYQILIVDDEIPALNLMQMLLKKHAPDFVIAQMCTGADEALAYLKEHTIDLLITDITMPQMNGIELSMAARKMQPDIHIFIISGYAEFEYAQSAIQASVDEYMLKPIGGLQMKAAIDKVRTALEQQLSRCAAYILPALACSLPYRQEDLLRYFVNSTYRMALVRWGGIDPRMSKKLRGTSLMLPGNPKFYALRGRDENEQVLVFPVGELEAFLSTISVYMTQRIGCPTWTVVYQPQVYPLVALDQFISQAIPILQQGTVLGRHQILPISLTPAENDGKNIPLLSISDLNQLQFYCSAGRFTPIKDYFTTLAQTLEKQAVPEEHAYQMMQQIILHFTGSLSILQTNYEGTKAKIAEMFLHASSYPELFRDVYALLFNSENNPRNRKLTTKELYASAVGYIEQNYAKPLNVQSVCDELGISPTYLSRLFRKYGNTTFNTFLVAQRMEAAIALLSAKPDMLLRDVAACVGYEDSSYFAKVFYQYTGKKPSKYVSKEE